MTSHEPNESEGFKDLKQSTYKESEEGIFKILRLTMNKGKLFQNKVHDTSRIQRQR